MSKFPTIDDWVKYNWKDHFKKANVNVDVKFTLRRVGKVINPIIVDPKVDTK